MSDTAALERASSVARTLDRRAAVLFGLAAAAAFILIMWLGRHGTFFQDEWRFIGVSGFGTVTDWFTPHNEHWSTLPFLAYRALMTTVGMHTYLPYLALLVGLHVAAATALFLLLRGQAGSLVALAGSALFLVLGSAYQNLFWAFQIGFVGSTAAGLWALVLLDRSDSPADGRAFDRRTLLATILLLASVMSSAMGLVFLATAGAEVTLDPSRRRALPWLILIGVVFIAWYVAIGRAGTANFGAANVAPGVIAGLPRFVFDGAVTTINGLIDGPFALDAAILLGLVGVAVVEAARGQLHPRVPAVAAGIVLLYLLVGVGRIATFGQDQATRPRYLYESAALLLAGLGPLVGRSFDILPDFARAWRTSSPATAIVAGLLALALLVGLYHNVASLRTGARFYRETAGELRAQIELMDRYGASLPYRPPASTRWSIPSPTQLATFMSRYGSPARDVLLPSDVARPTKTERDRAVWRLFGGALEPVPGPPPAGGAADRAPAVVRVNGASVAPDGGCQVLTRNASDPSPPLIVVAVGDGGAFTIETPDGGAGQVGLGRDAPPDTIDRLDVTFAAQEIATVHAPHLGDASRYQILVAFPADMSAARLCAAG